MKSPCQERTHRRRPRSAFSVLFLAIAVLWPAVVPPLLAGEGPVLAKADPAAALAFQAKMYAMVDRLDALVASHPGGKTYQGSVADARAALGQMSLEDFAYASPALAQAIAALENRLFLLSLRSVGGDSPRSITKSTGLPEAGYPNEPWGFSLESVTGTPGGGDDSSSNAGVCSLASVVEAGQSFALLNLGFAADALADTANRLCDQIIVVVGAGANSALLCIVTEILRAAINGIKDHELLCADIVTAAEVTGGYERIGHVHDDLETTVGNLTAEIDANEAKLVDLASDLVAHDQNLSAQMDEIDVALGDQRQFLESFREAMLQLDVEMHLAEASTQPVSSFRFPASATGYLDEVAGVVEAAIANLLAAGQGIGRAQIYFDDAEDSAATGDHEDAFDLYRRAYREAVK